MYVCMYVCNDNRYVCMYVCMHACMHACMHLFMHETNQRPDCWRDNLAGRTNILGRKESEDIKHIYTVCTMYTLMSTHTHTYNLSIQ